MKTWQSRAPDRPSRDSTGELFRLLDELANKRGLSTSQFTQELNARWQSYLSISQFTYPLVVALALKLMFRRRGTSFTEHLIFSLHCTGVHIPSIFASVALQSPARNSNLVLHSRSQSGVYLDGCLLAPRVSPRLRRAMACRCHQRLHRLPDFLRDETVSLACHTRARDCAYLVERGIRSQVEAQRAITVFRGAQAARAAMRLVLKAADTDPHPPRRGRLRETAACRASPERGD